MTKTRALKLLKDAIDLSDKLDGVMKALNESKTCRCLLYPVAQEHHNELNRRLKATVGLVQVSNDVE